LVTPRELALIDRKKVQALVIEQLSECPICQSKDFIVMTTWSSSTTTNEWGFKCKTCNARWEHVIYQSPQFKSNNLFLKLIHSSDKQTDKEFYLQNCLLPLSFWKTSNFEKIEKAFPVTYIQGNPAFSTISEGSIIFCTDVLSMTTRDGMIVEISWENLTTAELVTQKEMKASRAILVGVIPAFFWKKTEYYLRLRFLDNDIERTYIFVPERKTVAENLGLKSSKVWDLKTLWEDLNHKIKKKEIPSKEEVLDPLKILQLRYAKGEITKEQYEEMKKVLQL